ncbi:hypothetical protein EJ04DRAFT_516301 [Polyplosphaeria fusca]|uniref:Uncharacterized protein n=1 Tax=Polyplosphaeria fusca TaxID=682080 RepID=A0A9P4UW48_9PLEO|nr:hypothetical protein EJ04DRAFT_516301 [Polyplosphaeria fusca]
MASTDACRLPHLTLPICAPPGALPEAFQPSNFGFNKVLSSKCAYCTKGNEKCHPVSVS